MYAPTTEAEEADQFYEDLQHLLGRTPKKDVLFILGDWKAKVGIKEISRITGKFAFRVQKWIRANINRVLSREHADYSKHSLPTTRDDFTYGHHQMVYTEIRLIMFFAAEDGKALYIRKKQDLELTVAQIMSSLLQNWGLNWRNTGKTSRLFVVVQSPSCLTLCDCSMQGFPGPHHLTMSTESVIPFNHLILCCPLLLLPSIFPTIRVFPKSQLFVSGGQSIEASASASASVLPKSIQGWFPLRSTGLISLLSKGLSRLFSTPQSKCLDSLALCLL